MQSSDQIFIRGLKVTCHIGVPDEERAEAQELLVNARFSPFDSEAPLEDQVERTIDYYTASVRICEVAAERPRKLIETLAEDLAAMILKEFAVSVVSICIEKFIMPNTKCVGVSITREAL